LEKAALDQIAKRVLKRVDEGTTDMASDFQEIDTARYRDPARHELEKQKLFRECPQIVALSCDLPKAGDFLCRRVAGAPIVVARTANGDLASFLNVCSHRGAEVVAEGGNGRRWVCPYHAWTFASDTGELVGIPHDEGFEGLDRASRGLVRLPVQEVAGLIGVMLTPGADLDLAHYLGDLGPEYAGFDFEALWPVATGVESIAANWKLANDMGQEGYHVSFLHSDSVGPMTIPNTTLYDRYGDHHRLAFAAPAIAELRELDEPEWETFPHLQFVYGVFPSTTIVVSHHLIALQRLDPGARPGECEFRLSTYSATPVETDEHRDFTRAMFDGMKAVVLDEDYAMAAKIQLGIEAGTRETFVLGRNEPALQMVHAAYDRVVSG